LRLNRVFALPLRFDSLTSSLRSIHSFRSFAPAPLRKDVPNCFAIFHSIFRVSEKLLCSFRLRSLATLTHFTSFIRSLTNLRSPKVCAFSGVALLPQNAAYGFPAHSCCGCSLARYSDFFSLLVHKECTQADESASDCFLSSFTSCLICHQQIAFRFLINNVTNKSLTPPLIFDF